MKSRIFRFIKTVISKFEDPFLGLSIASLILLVLLSLSWMFFDTGQLLASLAFQSNNQILFIGQEDISFIESPDLFVVQGTSLKGMAVPSILSPQILGALIGGDAAAASRKVIMEYIVEPGDNLWSIANKFDISLESLLWANDMRKSSLLKVGKKLVVPPVSGVIYHVAKGDTISSIAKKYKGKTSEIVDFNELSDEAAIFVGDILIVPGGVMPPETRVAPQWVPIASSYFICPIAAPCRVTQGLHWYNAIDFSHGKCNEPVYAAAAGTVLKVSITNSTSRWAFNGAGNHLTIQHPNGVVTFYGHVSRVLVSTGSQVSQGQVIALVGGSPGTAGAGLSTGCHLHFGVHGARNPFR